MGVGPGSSAHPTCGTTPRTSLHGGRLRVAALPQQQQLDAQPGGVCPSATSLPIERLQRVCQPDQHSAAQLQQLETGPGGQSGWGIHPRGEGICLSLVLLDWVVFSEVGVSGGTLPCNDHTPVASSAMVSQTPSACVSSAQATTDISKPLLGSGPGAPCLDDHGAPASSRLAAVRHSFAGQRRSAQVVKLHLASCGRNTERAFASAFNVCFTLSDYSWCRPVLVWSPWSRSPIPDCHWLPVSIVRGTASCGSAVGQPASPGLQAVSGDTQPATPSWPAMRVISLGIRTVPVLSVAKKLAAPRPTPTAPAAKCGLIRQDEADWLWLSIGCWKTFALLFFSSLLEVITGREELTECSKLTCSAKRMLDMVVH